MVDGVDEDVAVVVVTEAAVELAVVVVVVGVGEDDVVVVVVPVATVVLAVVVDGDVAVVAVPVAAVVLAVVGAGVGVGEVESALEAGVAAAVDGVGGGISCSHLTCVAGPDPLLLRAAILNMIAGFCLVSMSACDS